MQRPDKKPPEHGRGRPGKSGPISPLPTKTSNRVVACVCGAHPHPEPAEHPEEWAAEIREAQGWPPVPPKVRCPWCGAEPGTRCRPATGRTSRRHRPTLASPHPSRLEVAS